MTIHKIDLTSPEFKQNPFPRFRELRDIGPILQTKLPMIGTCWITTTYEAADKVLRDKDRFCTDAMNAGRKSRTAFLGAMGWFLPHVVKSMMQNMLTMDEPDHRRLRSLVESAFVRQSVDEMRPGIDNFGDSAVVIKFLLKTRPLKQWQVKRELLRRIKNRFDELGIEIPFPHRTVYHRNLAEMSTTESGSASI